MVDQEQSEKYSLNETDYKKILKGAGIAFGAAFLFSISTWLGQGEVNWATFFQSCIPAAISTGINAGLKFFQGN